MSEEGELHRYKMTIAYEGTQYSGWQLQPNAVSIQGLLQQALEVLLRHEVHVTGSGRTDAGVHAVAQVAHFDTPLILDLHTTLKALAGILPLDVRVMELIPIAGDFHARFSAQGKIYHYSISTARIQSPFRRRYATHYRHPLDMELLKQAAQAFVGTHDFTTFANVAGPSSRRRNPVKTIHRIDVVQEHDGFRLEFEGSGFLYKMIRNLVGCILEVANKKRPLSDIPRLLEVKDRRQAGPSAPAHGLSLIQVHYPS